MSPKRAYRSGNSGIKIVILFLLVGLWSLTVWAQSAPKSKPTPTPAVLSYTISTLVPAGTLFQPEGLARDAGGNLYVADAGNSVVRYVNIATGDMTVFAGKVGRTYKDENPALPANCKKNGDGCAAEQATFGSPRAVAIDPAGNIYVSDFWSSTVRRFDAASGKVSTYAGGAGGWGPNFLHNPEGIATDAEGNLYIADRKNNAIRKVTPGAGGAAGTMTTIAGQGPEAPGCGGDGGKAVDATLTLPQDVAVDADGNIYIADTGCLKVRVIARDGKINTLVGTGTSFAKLTPSSYSAAAQPALSVDLVKPLGLALDAKRRLYISDAGYDSIFLYDPAGKIVYAIAGMGPATKTTTACSARTNEWGDGCPGTQAKLNAGYRVAVDAAGKVYIPEHGGGSSTYPPFTIRVLTPVPAAKSGSAH